MVIQGLTTLSEKAPQESSTPTLLKWDNTLGSLRVRCQNNPPKVVEEENKVPIPTLKVTNTVEEEKENTNGDGNSLK